MTASVYRVQRRNQKVELPALGLRCDEMEVPHPLEGTANHYYVGLAEVENRLPVVDESGQRHDDQKLVGLFAACIFGDTLAVIVAPQEEREAAHWLSIPLPGVSVQPVGQEGLFKKRPTIVKVVAEDVEVKLGVPARLHPNSRRLQARKSQDLFDLLRRAAAGAPRSESGSGA